MDFAAFISAITSVFGLSFEYATGVSVTLGQIVIFSIILSAGVRLFYKLRG